MRIVKIMWWYVVPIVLTSSRCTAGHEEIENSSFASRSLDLFPGFRLIIENDELRLKFNLEEIFPDEQSRGLKKEQKGKKGQKEKKDQKDDLVKNTKKKTDMQKLGAMMMMIPLVAQMLSIPVAIASIKMSLLKSVFVGKLAIILMLYNLLKNSQQASKTIVIQQPAEHHDHFYPHIHEESEEDNKGWLGWIG